MSNDGWSKEWPKNEPIAEVQPPNGVKQPWPEDWIEEAGPISEKAWNNLTKQGSNLVDAEAYLYFQCEKCQAILDPHTRSFAKLQQNRVDKGWLCVWNIDGMGYKVYCPRCGDGK